MAIKIGDPGELFGLKVSAFSNVKALVTGHFSTADITTFAVAIVATAIGEVKPILIGIALLIIMDWTTGIIKAALLRQLSSKSGVAGILKLLVYFVLITIGHQLAIIQSEYIVTINNDLTGSRFVQSAD